MIPSNIHDIIKFRDQYKTKRRDFFTEMPQNNK